MPWCTIPSSLKKGCISPIFKKGARNLPQNYRPITLTSTQHLLDASAAMQKPGFIPVVEKSTGNSVSHQCLLQEPAVSGYKSHEIVIIYLLKYVC